MIDLIVIHPGGAKAVYGSLAEGLTALEPPLWTRLIAGYVRDRGFTVAIIDAEARGMESWTVAREITMRKPRLVCIAAYGHQPSASTQMMPEAENLAREIKARNPWQKIIVVGGHVSALPARTLDEGWSFDYACKGEGPVTVVSLLANVLPEWNVEGLVWRNPRGEPTVNRAAPLLDVDELRGDVWDLLPMGLYRAHNWQGFGTERQPYASIYTSLGCPYKCSFCCINAPFDSNRYRMREPTDVLAEVTKLHRDHGVSTFKITDEMFVLNEAHYTDIACLLYDYQKMTGADFNIWAYARVDTVKAGKLDLLRKAGIKWLALGIESGSKHVRDGADKRMKNDDIVGVVRAIQAAGINVIGNYIFGLPDDDFKTMGETFNLACELNTEFANFYSAMAYPGSRLYAEAIGGGAALPESWSGYSQHSADCRPMDTASLTGAEVLQFRDNAFKAYFQRPRYLDMVRKKFGAEAVEQVQAMLSRQLHRNLVNDLVSA